jgi:centrin-1
MSKQALYKKIPTRSGLSDDEVDELRQAFELFDSKNTGRIDAKELKASMQALGYDVRNPALYEIVADLDTTEAARNKGIEFYQLLEAVNKKLGNKDSREGVRRIFELFVDDPKAQIVTLQSLKKVAREIGEQMSNDDIREIMQRASNNGSELTFEEFYEIMSKQSI